MVCVEAIVTPQDRLEFHCRHAAIFKGPISLKIVFAMNTIKNSYISTAHALNLLLCEDTGRGTVLDRLRIRIPRRIRDIQYSKWFQIEDQKLGMFLKKS